MLKKIRKIFFEDNKKIVRNYIEKISTHGKGRGLEKVIAELARRRLARKFGVYCSCGVQVGCNLTLPHPVGVVIGSGVRIGNNVMIYQNVTLGTKTGAADDYPCIGDGVTIYAGAVLIGGISIGANSVIGANAVVLSDFPANSVIVGMPAKYTPKENLDEQQD